MAAGNKQILPTVLGLAAALLVLAGCGGPTTAPPAATEAVTEADQPDEEDEHAEEETAGDVVRGGKLYDAWWVVLATDEHEESEEGHEGEEDAHGAEGPTTDHPLWATQSTNTRSGADTWRCKECHGWDYAGADGAYGSGSHFTGFPGVLSSAGMPVDDVVAVLSGSTNPDHDFSAVLGEHDLIDLATFLSGALIDTTEFVAADKSSLGDAVAGEGKFVEVCALCHGPDGVAINFHGIDDPEYVVTIALDNPWEFLHKVRFGQPGWPMPSAYANEWTAAEIADVLAYAQTLPEDATLTLGGRLYDKWWDVLEMDAPEGDMPLWATQTTNERSGTDTWRCKECHGWDYAGADGAYGSGSHFTGFQGVMGSSAMTAEGIAPWLDGSANPEHDFSAMGQFAIGQLVLFLQTEIDDVTAYVNADKSVIGDPSAGSDMWDDTCASCHGTDGKKMNFGDADEPEYVGTVARDNPWEFMHKVSFGQPGTPMPSGLYLGWSRHDIADLLSFAQTLPSE